MKTHKRFRIATLVLAVSLLLSSLSPASAAGKSFTDVPDNHWAKESIDLIAEGGLMNGYGGGLFGPADTFNIDHLATVIANINGQPREAKNGYWAYSAVDYCVNTLKCLPSQGEITAANYSKPCTRELAVHMLITGSGPVNAGMKQMSAADIPDYSAITPTYRDAVLKAYKYGMTNGTDSKGTFAPQSLLNRAQAATMLVRCGYTKSSDVTVDAPVAPQKGMTGEDLYNEIKSWGHWREFDANWVEPGTSTTSGGSKSLTNTERKYGGISVTLYTSGAIQISMPEYSPSYAMSDGKYVDANGKELTQEVLNNFFVDKNGKVVVASSWGYESRQLVKRILEKAFPNASNEAYNAMISVMAQEIYEMPSCDYASAIRWLDNRCYRVSLDNHHSEMRIAVSALDQKTIYDHYTQEGTSKSYRYQSIFGGDDVSAFFELDKG